MSCEGCGSALYAGWRFCPYCGQAIAKPQALTGTAPWEYAELEIEVDGKDFRRRGELIREQLQRVEREGWWAAEPTDWRSLELAGRVTFRDNSEGYPDIFTPKSVGIRLKRPAGGTDS